jgi:two-component system, LytTR family, response regulator
MQKTYKCLIADDSLIDRDVMEMYVGKINSLQIEAICVNGLEAAEVIKQKEIDIVFSDIDMPDLSGLELKQSLQQAPVFIFISSFAEYAVESYSLDVIDFIVKPVSLARLLKATNKAIEYIELKKKATSNTETIEVTPTNTAAYFFIKKDNGFTRIDNANLLYIESMGNFSKLFTQQKSHVTLISLKNLEGQLNADQFIRVHKQFIINLQHIQSINTVQDEIILSNNDNIPIGASYKNAFMELVGVKTLLR